MIRQSTAYVALRGETMRQWTMLLRHMVGACREEHAPNVDLYIADLVVVAHLGGEVHDRVDLLG